MTRRLLRVSFGALDASATAASLTRLMGKGEAAARRELMGLRGDAIEVDVWQAYGSPVAADAQCAPAQARILRVTAAGGASADP